MSKEIAKNNDLLASLGIVPIQDDTYAKQLGASNFLPYVRFQKDYDPERPKPNEFYLIENKKSVELGAKVKAVFLAWLPKAVNTESGESSYDKDSDKFQEIEKDAEVYRQNNPNMFGAEFLIYLTDQKKATTFFFGNKTLRNEIGSALGLLGKTGEFSPVLIPSKKYKDYWSATINASVTPAVLDDEDNKIIKDAYEKFQKLPEQAAKRLEESSASGDLDTATENR